MAKAPKSSGAGDTALVKALADILDEAGLVPSAMTLREPSLDDVFLNLTGRRVDPTEES